MGFLNHQPKQPDGWKLEVGSVSYVVFFMECIQELTHPPAVPGKRV